MFLESSFAKGLFLAVFKTGSLRGFDSKATLA